ncbi:hypothetical protein ACFX12_034673 [Malus domestica]
MVIEHSSQGEHAYDIFSCLLKGQIICTDGPINDDTSHVVVAQLLFLESENSSKPSHMYLNSKRMTRLDRDAIMQGLGFSSSSELLLPSSVKVFKPMPADLWTALPSSRSAPSASPSSPSGTRSRSFNSVATASTIVCIDKWLLSHSFCPSCYQVLEISSLLLLHCRSGPRLDSGLSAQKSLGLRQNLGFTSGTQISSAFTGSLSGWVNPTRLHSSLFRLPRWSLRYVSLWVDFQQRQCNRLQDCNCWFTNLLKRKLKMVEQFQASKLRLLRREF